MLDVDTLAWWLSERQCDGGGLNGRPEKQADVCYSWWILSSLSIMGKTDYINTGKLVDFILKVSEGGGHSQMAGILHWQAYMNHRQVISIKSSS